MQPLAKGLAACLATLLVACAAVTAATAASRSHHKRAAVICAHVKHVKKAKISKRAKRCRKRVKPKRRVQWATSDRHTAQGGKRTPTKLDTPTKLSQAKQATAPSSTPATISWAGWNILSNPIDPHQQSDLPFGTRSDWLQPWRAYMDTQPASMMRDALGINFNVDAGYASSVAQLLGGVGFKRARVEFGWRAMSYDDPTRLQTPSSVDTTLGALKASGIRPLILLNANDSAPGPFKSFNAQVTQSAPVGSRTLQVDPASAQQFVPGLSGFNVPGGYAAAFIATSVSPSGLVTLSQPLPVAVPAGTYGVTTLRYQPFAPPFTASGQPNPAFEQTLAGWLLYVKAVTQEAKKVLGSDNFDVEIWNELSFGSAFLSASSYYSPVPPSLQGTGSVQDQLLARTVAWLRNPVNGVANVGIGDGFANQTPYAAGSTVPAGTTAIDKHPYYGGVKPLPGFAGAIMDQRDVNALGTAEGTKNSDGNWTRPFVPTYRSFFPEYFLTSIQTDFLERDLAPTTTMIGTVAHGRNVMPAGASTPTQVWMTEDNFRPSRGCARSTPLRHATSRPRRICESSAHSSTRASPRSTSTPSPTAPGRCSIRAPPAAARRCRRFSGTCRRSPDRRQSLARRSLTLQSIADQGNWTQFAGDGTAPIRRSTTATSSPSSRSSPTRTGS